MRARGKNSLNEPQSRRAPHPVDIHVASRLRERRVVLGISQQKLAATLGLSFQQVYKYERGANRISAGRLYDLAKVLGVPLTFFFEDIADTSTPAAPLANDGHNDPLGRREAAEFFAAYRAISDPVVRRRLRQLVGSFRGAERFDCNRCPLPGPQTVASCAHLSRPRRGGAINRHPSACTGYRQCDVCIGRGPEHHHTDPQNYSLHRCAPSPHDPSYLGLIVCSGKGHGSVNARI